MRLYNGSVYLLCYNKVINLSGSQDLLQCEDSFCASLSNDCKWWLTEESSDLSFQSLARIKRWRQDIQFHCAQNNVDRSAVWLKQRSRLTGTNPGWHRAVLHTHINNSLASQCREVLNLQSLVVFRMDVILYVFPQQELNETRRKGGLVFFFFFTFSGCSDAAPFCLPIIIVWSALTTAFGQWSAWTFWEKPQHSTRDKCVGQEAPPPWIWEECCVILMEFIVFHVGVTQWPSSITSITSEVSHTQTFADFSLVFSAYLFWSEPMKM